LAHDAPRGVSRWRGGRRCRHDVERRHRRDPVLEASVAQRPVNTRPNLSTAWARRSRSHEGTEYDRGAVLRSLLPARVVLSMVAAFVFVGVIVAAGALLRDRHAPARGHPPVTSTVNLPPTTSTGR
jgi:hypothetical protein